MLLDLQRATAPDPLITVADAKAHLRVEHTDDDDLIAAYAAAATEHLDGYTGLLSRCLVAQEWTLHLPRFPRGRRIALPLPPLISVSSIEYVASDGVDETVPEDNYYVLDGPLAAVELKASASWPSTGTHPRAVSITFTAGYGAPADVPTPIRAAVLLMIGGLYANRGDADAPIELTPTVKSLLRPYDIPRV